jgi:hypothetical protein
MTDYVVLLSVDDDLLDGDDSIEHAVSEVNVLLENQPVFGRTVATVRPLSEVISA